MKDNTDENEEEEEKEVVYSSQVSIAKPMFFWILLLIIAMVINIVVNAGYINDKQMLGILERSANFILFMPGSLILPTVVGAVIGAEVGRRSKSMYIAIKRGLINGIYATIVYLITIFIIYEVIVYVLPSINPGVNFLEEDWLALPSAIVIILSTVFAALSHSRNVS